MKNKGLIGLIVALLLGGGGYVAQDQLGRGNFANKQDLAGSSSNAVSVPRTISFANSTSTDAANSFSAGAQNGFLDGGATFTQSVSTDGKDYTRLNILAVGGTASSTLSVRQQLSYDETNW